MHVCRKLNKHDYYFTLQFVNINIGTDQLENTYLSIHTHSNVQQLSFFFFFVAWWRRCLFWFFFACDITATGNVNWLNGLFQRYISTGLQTCLNLAVCSIGTSRKTQCKYQDILVLNQKQEAKIYTVSKIPQWFEYALLCRGQHNWLND